MSSPANPPPRRFVPQPIETTTRHSGSKTNRSTPQNPEAASSPTARSSNLPLDRSTPKRFKPEPFETTQRTNRHDDSEHNVGEDNEDSAPLLPHERSVSNTHSLKSTARRKFAVQPVETTHWSNRKDHGPVKDIAGNAGVAATPPSNHQAPPSDPPKRRKFKVEVIETAQRSKRSGDPHPAVLPQDKTNISPGDPIHVRPARPQATPLPPSNTPVSSAYTIPHAQLLKPQPNRQGSMHPHYNTRANTRQHSFKVPSLEAIESSGSSASDAPSLSRSSSHSDAESYKDATRMRESVDDRFSGYLLALAARAAEKQLRDQELAVFPTADAHQPIAHYANREDSDDEQTVVPEVPSSRRDSADELLLMQEMRKHGERIYNERQKEEKGAAKRKTAAFNVEFDVEAHQDAWIANATPRNLIGGSQKDPYLKQMRKAASPPMLGGDLDFPRCPSPEHARFDVTQGSDFLRNSMCYLSNSAGADGGLWGVGDGRKEEKKSALQRPSLAAQQSSKSSSGQGLWGGSCTRADAKMSPMPTGLITPKRTPVTERDDPFNHLFQGPASGTSVAGSKRFPPSPASSASGFASSTTEEDPENRSIKTASQKAEADAKLLHEFPDSFVTQVYNYLSLGFPALARKFDDELSRISNVPIEQLREDDKHAETRGYLRLGSGEVAVPASPGIIEKPDPMMRPDDVAEVKEEMCARWRALRVYCREWGRQMGVAEGVEKKKLDPHRAWGLPARKGSWGN